MEGVQNEEGQSQPDSKSWNYAEIINWATMMAVHEDWDEIGNDVENLWKKVWSYNAYSNYNNSVMTSEQNWQLINQQFLK